MNIFWNRKLPLGDWYTPSPLLPSCLKVHMLWSWSSHPYICMYTCMLIFCVPLQMQMYIYFCNVCTYACTYAWLYFAYPYIHACTCAWLIFNVFFSCDVRFVLSLENDLTVRAKTTEIAVKDFSSGSYATIFGDEVMCSCLSIHENFSSNNFIIYVSQKKRTTCCFLSHCPINHVTF